MWRNDEFAVDRRCGPGIGRRARSLVTILVLTTLTAGAATVVDVADSLATEPSTASGTSSADAAASCWEIKQLHPSSTDGVYWLRTTTMIRPERFYCDMTTDGGGWVLIGRGREGWTFKDYGQSTLARLREIVDGPDAFSPAALPGDTIDALLDGGAVADLDDGLRLRRATDVSGSTWQELRWHFLDLGAWSWAIGGGHRLASYSIDGVGGTGSNTKDSSLVLFGEVGDGNRGGSELNGWFTFPWSGHGRQAGFSYRGAVEGESNPTSYLWERNTESQAIPFTQLFLRPRITSTALAPIPDGGLPAAPRPPALDDRPAELAGGVVGVLKVGDTEPQLDTPVLTITTLGDRVYVGGKFSDTRDATTGSLVRQSYLAAFDRVTGAWISTFRPVLDGTVWDLDVAAGRLIVAGQFTNIDGVPSTSGLAALDPITGAVDTGWRASLTVTGTTTRPLARAIDVEDGWIYVAGNFTRISGPGSTLPVGRLARVAVADGEPDTRFRPDVAGIPYDLDAANGRVQLVGYFAGIDGDARRSVGTVDAATGAVVGGLADPLWTTSNVSRRYQQAVLAVGDRVWQGGSEHNVHVYRADDYALVKAYLTEDQGGDTQAFALAGNTVVQGSHANAWMYHDATAFRSGLTGFTRADVYNWIGTFDATTMEYDRSFVPGLRSAYSEGAWALHTDADGCVWFGGDFLGGPYVNGQRQYLEGFSRFCPADITPPTVPGDPRADVEAGGGVRVGWSRSADDRGGYIGYEVLRNDRVVSPLVYGTSYVDVTGSPGDRYFVRAVDAGGNRSATTTVTTAVDGRAPTTPKDLVATVRADLSVDLSWTASTDDVGVDAYRVLRNGIEIARVPGDQTSTNLVGLGAGVHWLQVQAVDAAGNESYKTPSVRIELVADDVDPPSEPTEPVPTTEVPEEPAPEVPSTEVPSTEVPSTEVTDTSNPSTPRDVAATVRPDGTIDVSWSPSRDNVGVTAYRVTRNAVEVAVVAETSVHLTTLGDGTHYIQVQAFDAAGNSSYRTASVIVTVVPPPSEDTSNPSTPRDLVTSAGPDGSVDASWSPSRDNVGVAYYRVTRNAVEVAIVEAPATSVNLTGLGPGTHYIQVQAFDVAGNSSYRTPSSVITL